MAKTCLSSDFGPSRQEGPRYACAVTTRYAARRRKVGLVVCNNAKTIGISGCQHLPHNRHILPVATKSPFTYHAVREWENMGAYKCAIDIRVITSRILHSNSQYARRK